MRQLDTLLRKMTERGASDLHLKPTRAPLILSAPGRGAGGARTAALVEFVDIYPTLCDLAGLNKPVGLEGTSLVPLLERPDRPWKKFAMSQYPRPAQKAMGYSIRTDRWRYTQWQRRDDPKQVIARELYDQVNDPKETKNVADEPANESTVKELADLLAGGWRGAVPNP